MRRRTAFGQHTAHLAAWSPPNRGASLGTGLAVSYDGMATVITASDVPPRRRARGISRALARETVRRLIGTRSGFRLVNALHRRLDADAKRRFYYAFFDEGWRVEGRWLVDFAGRTLILPLHLDFAPSWTAAIGFHGYDLEVHQLYEALLTSPRRPRVFFDVGANYGLHSLQLLAAGARVFSFEPNPACHPWFLECCRANGLRAEIQAVAVGDRPGSVELAVPDGRTYMGTVVSSVRAGWNPGTLVKTLRVPQVTLDDVIALRGLTPDLVKIDTEGSDLAVLRGASTLLGTARPIVAFESWVGGPERGELFSLLAEAGYEIEPLRVPYREEGELERSAFLASTATNFVARPRR